MRALNQSTEAEGPRFSLTVNKVDRTMVVDFVSMAIKKYGATYINMRVNPDLSGTWLVHWHKEEDDGSAS